MDYKRLFAVKQARDNADMNALLILINNIIDIYIFTPLAYVIASWLVAFRIVNPWQPFVRVVLQGLGRLHEPLLGRIRSVLPDLGGIDISPIIVLLAVQFGRNLLFEYLASYNQQKRYLRAGHRGGLNGFEGQAK